MRGSTARRGWVERRLRQRRPRRRHLHRRPHSLPWRPLRRLWRRRLPQRRHRRLSHERLRCRRRQSSAPGLRAILLPCPQRNPRRPPRPRIRTSSGKLQSRRHQPGWLLRLPLPRPLSRLLQPLRQRRRRSWPSRPRRRPSRATSVARRMRETNNSNAARMQRGLLPRSHRFHRHQPSRQPLHLCRHRRWLQLRLRRRRIASFSKTPRQLSPIRTTPAPKLPQAPCARARRARPQPRSQGCEARQQHPSRRWIAGLPSASRAQAPACATSAMTSKACRH